MRWQRSRLAPSVRRKFAALGAAGCGARSARNIRARIRRRFSAAGTAQGPAYTTLLAHAQSLSSKSVYPFAAAAAAEAESPLSQPLPISITSPSPRPISQADIVSGIGVGIVSDIVNRQSDMPAAFT